MADLTASGHLLVESEAECILGVALPAQPPAAAAVKATQRPCCACPLLRSPGCDRSRSQPWCCPQLGELVMSLPGHLEQGDFQMAVGDLKDEHSFVFSSVDFNIILKKKLSSFGHI